MNNRFNSELRNRAKPVLKLAALAAMAMALVGCASSGGLSGGYMQLGARAAPPAGFIDFCARKPQECGLKVSSSPALDPEEAQARLHKTLYRKYLWEVAFPEAPQPARSAPVQLAAAPQTSPQISDLIYRADDRRPASDAAARAPAAGAGEPFLRPALLRWTGKPDAPEPALGSSVATEADAIEVQGPSTDQALAPAPVIPTAALGASQDTATPEQVSVLDERAAAAVIPLTEETLAQLNMVNRLVNQLIVFAPDSQVYGKEDYWAEPLEDQVGPKRGDCEDYVLEKRRALLQRGVPEGALSIAVVRTLRGEGHAVLLVATDKGELVLDSLNPAIMGWRDAPYEWIERQAPGAPMVWFKTGARPKALTEGQMIASGQLVPAASPG
jgi:predicted transglutaminase-like cysteine proteinase